MAACSPCNRSEIWYLRLGTYGADYVQCSVSCGQDTLAPSRITAMIFLVFELLVLSSTGTATTSLSKGCRAKWQGRWVASPPLLRTIPAGGELQCSTRTASPTVVIMVVMCCSVRTASRTTMGACPVSAIMARSSSAAATPAWPSMLVRLLRITSPL
jgi:hypothetical protein